MLDPTAQGSIPSKQSGPGPRWGAMGPEVTSHHTAWEPLTLHYSHEVRSSQNPVPGIPCENRHYYTHGLPEVNPCSRIRADFVIEWIQ